MKNLKHTADAQAPGAAVGEESASATLLFNETGWDRRRGNTDIVVAASALRNANGDSGDLVNYNASALLLVIDITAITGTTPSLTITIEGKDPASGKYFTVLASAALTAVQTKVLRVAVGLTAVANTDGNAFLPRTFRARWTIGGTAGPTVTFSLGASLVIY